MLSLITAPSATTTLESIGVWSTAFFADVFPIVLIGVALLIGGMIVSAVFGWIIRAAGKVFGRGRGGRRGRRR